VAERGRPVAEIVLDAVGEPTRRAMLAHLRRGPCSVAELAAVLPVTRPAVSQHLKVLLAAGLVSFDRTGTRHVYRLDGAGFAALRSWVEEVRDTTLDAYATRAGEIARGSD
jgi:DNA-binding transcriptional ArsR family regulator